MQDAVWSDGFVLLQNNINLLEFLASKIFGFSSPFESENLSQRSKSEHIKTALVMLHNSVSHLNDMLLSVHCWVSAHIFSKGTKKT